MPDSPELLLEVKLPDGESRSYTLEYGRLTIGSGADCEIRIEEPDVAEAHALLLVELDGITLVNLRDPSSVRIGGAPVSGNRSVEAHDPISVAGVRITLLPYGYTGEFVMPADRDIPRALEKHAYEDLQKGMPGYRLLRDRLYTHVDPSEAAAGERQFRRMRWGLFAVIGAIAVWRLTAFFAPFETVTSWLEATYPGLRLLGLLVLGGVLGLSVAGRVVIPLLALWLLVNGAGEAARTVAGAGPISYDTILAIYVIGGLAIGYGAGALFDYGIAMRPGRANVPARRFALVGFAAAVLGFAILIEEPFVFSLPAILLCGAWGWWPGPQIEARWRRALRRDTRVLATAAELRWLRSVGGVVLATILGFFPFFLFFNTFELRDGLSVDPDTWPVEQAIIGTRHDPDRDVEVAWFWGSRGRLLRGSDFYRPSHRVFADWHDSVSTLVEDLASGATGLEGDVADEVLADQRRVLVELLSFTENTTRSGVWWLIPPLHERLFGTLDRFDASAGRSHAVSDGEFVEEWNDGPLLVMQIPTPGQQREPDRWYWLETLDTRSIPATEVEWVRNQVLVLPPVLVVFGMMGFLFLVRRGGDSPTARWIGIWLAGEAAAYFLFAVGDYVDPRRWRMMTLSASESPLWASFADTLDLLEWIAGWNSSGLWAVSVPFCFLWVHLCWPTSPWRYPAAWRRSAEIVGKAALVGGGLFVVGWIFRFVLEVDDPAFDVRTATAFERARQTILWTQPALLVALLVGAVVRRRHGGASGEVARLGITPVLTFVGVMAGPVLLYQGLKGWTGGAFVDRFFYTVTAVGGLLVMIAVVGFLLLLRRNFLHVANASTLVWVALVILVPAAVGVIEAVLVSLFEGTPLIPVSAARALGIFFVAVFLPKIHSVLHRGVERLLVPRLPKIRQAVDETLEKVAENGESTDRRGEVSRALEELGVTRYAVYKRGRRAEGDGMVSFDRYLHRLADDTPDDGAALDNDAAPETLPLSDYLRDFLARRRTFVDLEAAPFEWGLFFQQFELHRLERVLGFRYMLPICLGHSVRGLLLLGDGEAERKISQEPAAGRLGTLGLGTLEG